MRRSLTLLLATAALAIVAAPASASTTIRFGAAKAESALRYWTPDRMRAARPVRGVVPAEGATAR